MTSTSASTLSVPTAPGGLRRLLGLLCLVSFSCLLSEVVYVVLVFLPVIIAPCIFDFARERGRVGRPPPPAAILDLDLCSSLCLNDKSQLYGLQLKGLK